MKAHFSFTEASEFSVILHYNQELMKLNLSRL